MVGSGGAAQWAGTSHGLGDAKGWEKSAQVAFFELLKPFFYLVFGCMLNSLTWAAWWCRDSCSWLLVPPARLSSAGSRSLPSSSPSAIWPLEVCGPFIFR